jgi:hypothetical protein
MVTVLLVRWGHNAMSRLSFLHAFTLPISWAMRARRYQRLDAIKRASQLAGLLTWMPVAPAARLNPEWR